MRFHPETIDYAARGARLFPGGRLARILVALVAITGTGTASAQIGDRDDDGVFTHLEMLRATTVEAVVEMLGGLPVSATDPILVSPAAHHRSNWLVADAIAAELATRGYRVQVSSEVLPANGGSAPADTGAVDVAAPQDPTNLLEHLMSQEGSVATADAAKAGSSSGGTASAGVVNHLGPVVEFRIGQFGVRYVDESRTFFLGPKRVERAATVDLSCRLLDEPAGDIVWVGQGDAIALDHIAKSKLAIYESDGYTAAALEKSSGLRLVEPVLVGGIVAGLVYLFYTNQN